ncbi:MAG TPA: DUF2062 domain-containing protein [Labilithrix sp.]|nr:DUF2062 domain-containing protein [Labilithrix sp.]
MFRRLWEKIKTLWRLALSERASPRDIGWAVGIGAFAGCTPAIGFHGALSLALATVFRKNRLFAWLGSRISNMVFLPFIALAEVQISHRLRTGDWVTIDREHAVDQAGTLLLDWCLGTIPVGGLIGLVMGVICWALARRRDRRRAEREAAEAGAAGRNEIGAPISTRAATASNPGEPDDDTTGARSA